ncbi:MAG: tol-pal system-associated acyl-CoA thioesterase [Acidimicrobiia bacterium]|nr:tol-pal system-associated acyl-CoA thioesterase [Acidimicrobiia bacterium]
MAKAKAGARREAGLAERAEEHIFRLRVYYEDTDADGVVYYANYLRFAERARTEMLRERGIESSRLMAEEGVAFAVRRCAADYLRPARLDDRLEVRTRLTALGGASLDLEQRIVRADDGAEAARLDLTLACMTRAGKAARIPAKVRGCLHEINGTER